MFKLRLVQCKLLQQYSRHAHLTGKIKHTLPGVDLVDLGVFKASDDTLVMQNPRYIPQKCCNLRIRI